MMRVRSVLVGLACLALVAGACAKKDNPTGPSGEGEWVDLFPTPVSDATTPFGTVDDDTLAVPFTMGFTFTFYGTAYDSIWLNTNGGFTFGNGEDEFDAAATSVVWPGVGVFWGDLDAGDWTSSLNRANQMRYQQQADRFLIQYNQINDNDVEIWMNTATVTLFANGKIEIVYGDVLSTDILVGIWDGSHTNDQYMAVMSTYNGYTSVGTGIILFDDFGAGPTYVDELNGMTITFNP